ncbi:MAG: hypothetical protein U9R06_03460 [Patescibacteria group bacterium]|nr:hypothetical protein [Patescibacteria group bacterium]
MEDAKNSSQPAAKSKSKGASTKGLDIIIVGAITAIFFLCPLFFTSLVSQGLGFEKMILFYFFVLLGIVAWVTKGVIIGELNLKRTPLDWPIVIILAIFSVSTILSVSSKDSLIGSYGNSSESLVAVIMFALFYYLVINNLTVSRIKVIFFALVSSSSLLAIYSFLQLKGIYLLPIDFTQNHSFNPLGSLSGLTMYLVIMLPIFIVAAAQTQKILPALNKGLAMAIKIALLLIILINLIILTLLNGFTFWPIAIVGAVIVLMFFLAKIIKINNNNLLIPLFAFLALIILLVLGNFNIMSQDLPAEVSLSRGASWDIAKSSIAENPIFGSGPSTFYYDFSKFKTVNFNNSPLWNIRFDDASGILFELLASVGILGALIVIVLALIALSMSFLSLIKNENKEINSIQLALFASFISAGLFAFLFSQNNSLILTTILISVITIAVSLIMYPEKFSTLKLSFRASAKYALALAAVFLVVSAGVVVLFTMGLKMYLGDTYAKKAIMSGDANEKIVNLNQAVALAPYQDSYYVNLANNYMALANQAALGGGDQASIQNNLSLAIESGKKAVEIAPNKAANNESLALIYENASFYTRGALEWSENLYNKVIELDPQNPAPFLRIALVNMARANAETDKTEKDYYINEAIKKYDEAIAKKGDLAAAHYGKAIAYEKLNDIDGAIDNLKKANLVSNNNIDYIFELGRLYFNRGVAQPNLGQTASQQIAENDIRPDVGEGATTTAELSITPSQPTGAVSMRNDDLNAAEQIFLSILRANPKHANALYSTAILYQKINETEKAKIMVQGLLDVLTDEATKQAVRQQFADIL